MRKILSLVLAVVFLLSGASALAEALPYEGEEILWHGVSPDYQRETESPCRAAFDQMAGNLRVEWEYLPGTDFDEKAKIFLASGDLPDIIPLTDPSSLLSTYGEDCEALFLNFNDYLDDMPNLRSLIERYPVYDDVLAANGDRYFLFGNMPSDGAGEFWFANKTLLDECGVQVPETFEEFIAALRAVKAKRPDAVPYQSYWNLSYATGWIARMMGAQSKLIYWDDAAGAYKAAYKEDGAKRRELIETMATLYKEGLINPEIATMSFEQELNTLGSGNWALATSYIASIEGEAYKLSPGEELPIDVEPILPPASPDGKRYIPLVYITDAAPWWVMACNKNVEHPEQMAAYLDTVLSPESSDLCNYGIEGVHYVKGEDGKRIKAEGLDNLKEGIGYVTNTHYMIGIYPDVVTSDQTIAKKTYAMAQAALADGTLTGVYDKASVQFDLEAGEERAKLESAMTTYVDENEAKFIYGLRDMSEWDAYVAELEKYVDIDRLLELYNGAQIKVKTADRIYLTE